MVMDYRRIGLVIGLLLLTAPSLAEPLTAEAARTMAAAAERAARAQGFAIVISIVDSHGNLKHFHRMDGASTRSIPVSYTHLTLPTID